MKLYDVISNIQRLALADPNIGFCEEGDVYELNKQMDISYPACIVTQSQHVGNLNDDTVTYAVTIFMVDRLTEDKSNKLEVQSWAVDAVRVLIARLDNAEIGFVNDLYTIQTFTERFESLCAGAYVTLNIVTADQTECCLGDIQN